MELKFRKKPRMEPKKRGAFFLKDTGSIELICPEGYTRLDRVPEVVTGCLRIATLISSMTIYLMTNTDNGDQRIINELSRRLDIEPNPYMTRRSLMEMVVMNLLLYGKGNSIVIPKTRNGLLESIEPVDPQRVSFIERPEGYELQIDGIIYGSDEVLHFVHNPDPQQPWKGRGITSSIQEIADNLRQATATKKGFFQAKWKPSIIVKVDGMIEEFSSKAGRQKLMDEYLDSDGAGKPWLIPADQFDVQQVKPLTLADLAINDAVNIDKQTVAAILGVPPFVLGVGTYNKEEWNNFINSTIRPIAQEIEQELTRKLLWSEKMYWKFNVASLYAYDIQTLATVYGELFQKGIVDGNEVRDKLGMSPREGLSELVVLENYIPLTDVGNQKKLTGGQDE